MSLEQYKDANRKELWDILQIQMQVLQEENTRVAELEKECAALKKPILQLLAEKIVLLNEPNVLTGMYRMQLRDGYWAGWESIEALKEQGK